MTNSEAISTLCANVMVACERAKFDSATCNLVEEALDMAIEALEQSQWIPISGEAFDMMIEELEQSHWTPISKEPDTASHVLVTAKWGEDDYEVFETDYWVVKHGANDPTWKYQAENKRELDHITAWRRMPEPYKGGE